MKSPSKICLELQRGRRMWAIQEPIKMLPLLRRPGAPWGTSLGCSCTGTEKESTGREVLPASCGTWWWESCSSYPSAAKAKDTKLPLASLHCAAVLHTAPKRHLLEGPPGRLRKVSTVSSSRIPSALPYFL